MKQEQYIPQTSDYEMKTYTGSLTGYNELMLRHSVNEKNKDAVEQFRQKLLEFHKVNTLSDAKELLKKIKPVQDEFSKFRIGDAECIIINQENLLRITLKNKKICMIYNFE